MATSHDAKTIGFPALQQKWGWFAGLGILMMIAGLIAFGNLLAATVISVFFVGGVMVAGGVLHLIHAFQVKTWERVLYWALSGALYAFAGVMAFVNPLLTSAVLTLLIGAALIVAGAFRLWLGFTLRGMGSWGWVALSGVVTLLAGFVIAAGWPVNSLWILGLFLSVDLFLQGSSLLAFAIALRRT